MKRFPELHDRRARRGWADCIVFVLCWSLTGWFCVLLGLLLILLASPARAADEIIIHGPPYHFNVAPSKGGFVNLSVGYRR